MCFANQISAAIAVLAEIERGVDRTAVTHFVIHSGNTYVVRLAATAIAVNTIFWDNE